MHMPATSAVRASGSIEMTPVNPEMSRPLAVRLRPRPEQVRGVLREPNRSGRWDGAIALEKALPRRRHERFVRRSQQQTQIDASPRG